MSIYMKCLDINYEAKNHIVTKSEKPWLKPCLFTALLSKLYSEKGAKNSTSNNNKSDENN